MGQGRVKIVMYMLLALVTLDLAIAAYAVLEGPIPVKVSLGTPMAYKNIYLHVPIAISTYIVLAGALVSAILYLRKGGELYSRLVDSYVKYGILFGAATLVTGSSWASESWGMAWNWDPKQTAVLFMFLAYLAYFPLKNSIRDPDRASRISAAYAVAAFVMVPMSFLASRVMESLHPTGEAIAQFAEGGSGGIILGARILLMMAIGVSLPILHATGKVRVPKLMPVAILLVGVAVAVYVSLPLIDGGYARVVDAIVTPDGLVLGLELSTGERITFSEPVVSPINPPVTGEGQSTLIGHLVKISDGGIQVLYHWSTPFTFIVYTILLSVGLYILGGRRWIGQ